MITTNSSLIRIMSDQINPIYHVYEMPYKEYKKKLEISLKKACPFCEAGFPIIKVYPKKANNDPKNQS